MNFQAPNIRAAAERLGQQQAALKAQELRTEVVLVLSAPGRGREYRRRSVTHQASAPGDSPAVDRGRLRQSITVTQRAPGHYRVGTNVVYALPLEFGTRKIAARPFMRVALERLRRRA